MGETHERLDRYWAGELGCTTKALYSGGVTVCAPPHRAQPRWMGWMVPLECITVAEALPGTGAISITPSLANPLSDFIHLPTNEEDCLPPHGKSLFRFARLHLSAGYPKVHHILACDPATFAPAAESLPITVLDMNDPQAGWFRQHFDGPIFVARNDRGVVVSWAAIKCKSDDVWEMAVVTEAFYRGRGLARSVVSRATQAAFDAGKVPLYLHEVSNMASAKVCRGLGYQFYGYELTCECGRMPKEGF